ncbi:MAG TPA: hypothetical protein VKE69_07750, partial [Planctomycetota bacterium]|nr:hypothetical protein [Planctomycetota bacterium]
WRDHNPPSFQEQYVAIWEALTKAPSDVIVISGDVHHSRVLEIPLGKNRFVYELVTSPACHIPGEISTVATAIFGLKPSQGRGSVSFPQRIGLPPAVARGFVPGGLGPDQYLMGCDDPETIALLHLSRLDANTLKVGVAFVNLETNRFAQSCEANIDDVAGSWWPTHLGGEHAELFRLKRRPPA